MKEWKIYKLSEIADIQTGPFGSQLHNNDYVDNGTPIVTVEHLGNRKFSTRNLPCVSDADKARLSKYILNEGDIVFSRVGSVDRCSYVSSDEDGWMFSGRCLRVRCNNMCNPLFLYYYFCKETIKQYIRSIAVGATMPSINTKLLSDLPITLPSIDVQDKAVQILSRLDDKIELNRQINDNLEQQAQTAFNNIIAQYSECETVNLSEIAILNPKRAIAKGTFARSIEMAQLPTSGSFPAGWDMKEYNGGMKFQNGDTLMARITPCLENGKVAYINFLEENEVAFGSTEYIVITSKGAIAPEVFYFLTRHNDFVDFAVKNMNGSSGRQRVSAETIGTYKLPIISPEDMVILETIAKEALNKIKYNSLENIRLSEIRDTLLPKLMSGELEINEIDC